MSLSSKIWALHFSECQRSLGDKEQKKVAGVENADVGRKASVQFSGLYGAAPTSEVVLNSAKQIIFTPKGTLEERARTTSSSYSSCSFLQQL